jgi:hypothetical protein
MEVHTHTHTPRKKWTHYFWEFFMLFLAVFCGFLAENIREHNVEHQREKKFAQLLYVDLKTDSASLLSIIKIKKWKGKKIDSLVYFLSAPDLQKNAASIYYYSAYMGMDVPFKPNDATIQQLRSSGSLRYFSDPRLYNSIASYYSDCLFYLENENKNNLPVPPALISKIFLSDKLFSLVTITPNMKDAIHYPQETLQLLAVDKPTINEFMYYAKNVKISNDLSMSLLQGMISNELNELIIAMQKEYHLK